MSDTYAVKVEVAGLLSEDDKGKTVRYPVKDLPGLIDSVVRDDGTGILYFEWTPEPDEAGAGTWTAARENAEHYRSLVQGAGLPVLTPCSIVVHDAPPADKPKKAKTTKV